MQTHPIHDIEKVSDFDSPGQPKMEHLKHTSDGFLWWLWLPMITIAPWPAAVDHWAMWSTQFALAHHFREPSPEVGPQLLRKSLYNHWNHNMWNQTTPFCRNKGFQMDWQTPDSYLKSVDFLHTSSLRRETVFWKLRLSKHLFHRLTTPLQTLSSKHSHREQFTLGLWVSQLGASRPWDALSVVFHLFCSENSGFF